MALTEAEAKTVATSVIRSLTGNRWTCPPVSVTDRLPFPVSRRVILGGRPVLSIESVMINDIAVPLGQYKVYNGNMVVVGSDVEVSRNCDSEAWIEVTYTFGTETLPAGIENAIDILADELVLSSTDWENCRLPQRVTSVTRQGVSWTLLDPQDFLEDGRTGIYEIDLLLRVYNPGAAKARARVFSPTHPPALRRIV